MISPSDFKNGLALMHNNEPWTIVEFQHVKPGKGGAFIRTKLKHLKNGKVIEFTFRPGESFPEADVLRKKIQYLYNDGSSYFFMDDEYEQMEVTKEALGENAKYLVEESKVDGIFLDSELFNIEIPKKMDFKVTSAPPGVKGDSATGATKQVEVEGGVTFNVPLFIKEGDRIRINTETGQYVERVND